MLDKRSQEHEKRTGEASKLNIHLDDRDGCFWMKFSDFYKYFSVTSICYYQPHWHYNYIEANHNIHLQKLDTGMRISTQNLIRNPHPDRINSQDMPFSMIKFNNPADIDDDCILTFN